MVAVLIASRPGAGQDQHDWRLCSRPSPIRSPAPDAIGTVGRPDGRRGDPVTGVEDAAEQVDVYSGDATLSSALVICSSNVIEQIGMLERSPCVIRCAACRSGDWSLRVTSTSLLAAVFYSPSNRYANRMT